LAKPNRPSQKDTPRELSWLPSSKSAQTRQLRIKTKKSRKSGTVKTEKEVEQARASTSVLFLSDEESQTFL